mmetsp:Transcript_2186/g.8688  ORF Transcript_2186/g.8688 Transcript_2186/m.8688 type:complete len:273 (-) Transcript_2186:1411-2229(-)
MLPTARSPAEGRGGARRTRTEACNVEIAVRVVDEAAGVQCVLGHLQHRAIGNDAPWCQEPAAEQPSVGTSELRCRDALQLADEAVERIADLAKAVHVELPKRRIVLRVEARHAHERAIVLAVDDDGTKRRRQLAKASKAIARGYLAQQLVQRFVHVHFCRNVADQPHRVAHRTGRRKRGAALVLGRVSGGVCAIDGRAAGLAQVIPPHIGASLGSGDVVVSDGQVELLHRAGERKFEFHVQRDFHVLRGLTGIRELAVCNSNLVLTRWPLVA